MYCNHCGETRNDMFYTYSQTRCKQCHITINKQRYRALSPAEQAKHIHRSSSWQDKNIIEYRWSSAKARAGKASVPFNITKQHLYDLLVQQEGLCFYSKCEMKLSRDDKRFSVSIDRLDNSEGYIEGNVVLCCTIANRMKSDLPLKDFKFFIDAIYNNTK